MPALVFLYRMYERRVQKLTSEFGGGGVGRLRAAANMPDDAYEYN